MFKLLISLLFLSTGSIAQDLEISGKAEQGALVYIRTDGKPASLSNGKQLKSKDGWTVIGFGRDHPAATEFLIDGQPYKIAVAKRRWKEEKVNGLPPAKVNPPAKANPRIAEDAARLKASRKNNSDTMLPQCFVQPVEGRISGVFGSRRVLNGEPKRPHYGLDIAAPAGTPIKAMADGTVTLAMEDSYYNGNVVVLDHGLGITSLYAHMDSIAVTDGQTVRRGDVIGAVGSTGRSTGPHLHLAVAFFDSFLDPQSVILHGKCPDND